MTVVACILAGLVACGDTLGRTALDDGNELRIEGRGAKANIAVKCLTESEIKQLTGSNINPHAAVATCYTVIFVSSASSSIAKAITAYTRAETELNEKIANVITGGQAPITMSIGGEIAKKAVAASLEKDPVSASREFGIAVEVLDASTKSDIKATLQDIAAKATDPQAKANVDALLLSI